MSEGLWKLQTVKVKGKLYHLTRLGSGQNSAPKIMTAVLAHVLRLDERIKAAISHNSDDIIIDNRLVDPDKVIAHLKRYGPFTKPEEHGWPLGQRLARNVKCDLVLARRYA